jgi:hypothetical protein
MFSNTENYESFSPSAAMRQSAEEGDFTPLFKFDEGITDIRISLKNVAILKKKELLSKAEVFVAWVITDDTSNEPIQMNNTNIFKNIKKGDSLPLGPSGLTLYRNENDKLPNYIDFKLLVIESDQGVRDFGAALDEIRKDEQYKAFRDAIISASAAAAPTAALITAGSDFALKMIAKRLSMNKDDQMLLVEGSYDRKFDDLGVIYGLVKKHSKYAQIEFQTEKYVE